LEKHYDFVAIVLYIRKSFSSCYRKNTQQVEMADKYLHCYFLLRTICSKGKVLFETTVLDKVKTVSIDYNRCFLRKMLGTRYGPIGTRFL